MRPRHWHQCIGPSQEGNQRMKEAWARQPVKRQTVYVLRGDKMEVQEYLFSHFTQAGARLWIVVDGHYYGSLINWDIGDQLFVNKADAFTNVIFRAICEKSKAELKVKELDAIIAQNIKGLKNVK